MSWSLDSDGITIELPQTWEAQIRPADPDAAHARGVVPSGARERARTVVLHAANFALPAQRGDYGSGAAELMGPPDILCCLLEHDPADVDLPLFERAGVPRLTADLFSPTQMQRTIAGMAGTQHFFHQGGRAFCLYVVLGSYRGRMGLAAQADKVVSSLAIAPG